MERRITPEEQFRLECSFEEFTNAVPELSRERGIQLGNADKIVYRYAEEWFPALGGGGTCLMLVELKACGGGSWDRSTPAGRGKFSQFDLLGVLDQALRHGSGVEVETIRRHRTRFVWFGCHVITWMTPRFEESPRFLWDNREVDRQTLADLLGFLRDPYTLEPRREGTLPSAPPRRYVFDLLDEIPAAIRTLPPPVHAPTGTQASLFGEPDATPPAALEPEADEEAVLADISREHWSLVLGRKRWCEAIENPLGG